MKILICGDSFAAPNQNDFHSWHYLLGTEHNITNNAQAGCSEYRILKQLEKSTVTEYDSIIISHTSPNRVYIKQHPCYSNREFYKNADLIYLDVLEHLKEDSNNKTLHAAKNYFESVFDEDYYHDIYMLIVQRIRQLTENVPCLHLLTLYDKNVDIQDNVLNLTKICKVQPGLIGHYSKSTHYKIYELINQWLK